MDIDQPPVTDDLLSTWVDGQLTPVQHRQVQAWIDSHPQDLARVTAWATDRQALAALFDPVLDEPLPPTWTALLRRPAPRPAAPRWAMAAAAAGLLLA